MPLWKQALLRRYMEKAGDEGSDTGGTGSGDEGNKGTGEGTGSEGAKQPPSKEPPSKEPVKPAISDSEAKLLKENMKRKEDLQKATDELKAAKEALAAFDGLDAAELRKLVSERKSAEEAQLTAKGQWDQLKDRMAAEHTTATKALTDQVAALQAQLSQSAGLINELTIGSAFNGSKFLTEETVYTPAKARKVYAEHFDLVDGNVVGFDKPRGAQGRTALVDQYGNSVAFDEAMKKIVEADSDRDSILKSKVKSGAGSSSQANQATRQPSKEMDSMGKISAGLTSLKLFS